MCYLITRVMRGVLSHHTFVRTGCAILPHVCVIGDVWYGILYLITCLLGRGVLSYHMCVSGDGWYGILLSYHTFVRAGCAILSHVCYRVSSHVCETGGCYLITRVL